MARPGAVWPRPNAAEIHFHYWLIFGWEDKQEYNCLELPIFYGARIATESLRLDVSVCLGDDASTDELDDAARLLRRELLDAGLSNVELADGGQVPSGAKSAEALVFGSLRLTLFPSAVSAVMALLHDWAGRRPGRTLKLAYGAGEKRLELEYDPEKTDINQVMALLLRPAPARRWRVAGPSAGGDVVGGDKVSHVSAGADAVGRDKITEIHVAAGSTLIINDPALGRRRPAGRRARARRRTDGECAMPRKLALVIGNSDYQDPALAQLKAPDADVRALTELLRDPEIGQFEHVTALVNEPEAHTRRAIAGFFVRARPDDQLLLYFSGHGLLDDKGRLYLAAKDTQRDLPQATAISAAFVTDAMDSSRSRQQLLILDCCHSGAFARGARAADEAKAVTQATFEGVGAGRAVLTATDATQYAWEGESVIGEAENSVFTHFMIEGLRTGAADTDSDGRITLEELYTYLYSEVVRQTPKQTPRKWSYNQQGEFVIARNPHPARRVPCRCRPTCRPAWKICGPGCAKARCASSSGCCLAARPAWPWPPTRPAEVQGRRQPPSCKSSGRRFVQIRGAARRAGGDTASSPTGSSD